jgi:predicted ATPase/DNA-binding XRE family transcriptional regulator
MYTKSDTTDQETTERIAFGMWLRQRRRELDLTQQAFADQVGCARITLSRIEADTLKPSRELALLLLEKVGIPESERESWVRFARGQGGMPSQGQSVSVPKPLTNLPTFLTSFIGREKEQADLSKLIDKHRLVTLTGSGGTGKTRLSLQVALEQLGNFKAGVWLVELAPIRDAAFIVSTIASVFNLREGQGLPLLNTVMDYLRAKEVLLLLDNCEHLVEASAQIANQLLLTCPHLKIIASSREALGIDGETVYRVPSLNQDEAIRLFAECATKTEPHFHMTDKNASFVAQICSRLDGIPLAIELAAARVKIFTPQQIAERLDDRFQLLTSDSRIALPRQQTLRALMDWSYLTLNEMEQHTLRGLAVFSGGWTFEAAESVIGESEALSGLSGLVNKSLINVEEQDGKSRYTFLETIRQYAMDKLLESGEAPLARDRHLDYYLKLAKGASKEFFGTDRKYWSKVLELEHDNLRSALRWGLDRDPLQALTLAGFLGDFWMMHGYLMEGQAWCTAALASVEKLPHADSAIDRGRARGFHVWAVLANNRGEHRVARTAVEKAIDLYRQLGDTKGMAGSLIVLGTASGFSGDPLVAFDSIRESERISREMGHTFELAWALAALSLLTFQTRGPAAEKEVEAYVQESLSLVRDNPLGNVFSKEFLARQAYVRGDIVTARKYADEVLAYYQEMGVTLRYTTVKSTMAHFLRKMGNFAEALPLYRETIVGYQDLGHRGAIAHQLECFAFIAKAQELGERAVKLFGAAEALREISNSLMTPQEQIEYDQQLAGLRAGMDEAVFTQLWAEGRAMTMDQAIAFAMESESIKGD